MRAINVGTRHAGDEYFVGAHMRAINVGARHAGDVYFVGAHTRAMCILWEPAMRAIFSFARM